MLRHRGFCLSLLVLLAGAAACSPSAKPASRSGGPTGWPAAVDAIATYQAADRQRMLESGAREEGTVTWYTVLAGDIVDALAQGFQQKYPYIKVDANRPSGQRAILTKVNQEAQAKHYSVDVVQSGLTDLLPIRDDVKGLTPYFTPEAKSRPQQAVTPASGGLSWWINDSDSYIGFAYNTNAIPDAIAPKTTKDLLNPALKGKMAVVSTSGVPWVGNVLAHESESFVQQLSKQDIAVHEISAKALADLVVSGEVAASPTIYSSHASQAIQKGAPIKWVPLEPVLDGAYSTAIALHAPHPHAALLFADFLLGPDAQKIFQTYLYGNPSRDPGFKSWVAGQGETADQFEKDYNHWQDDFTKSFVQK
ncbi:MAG TPA: extracellular solute-binding protein [Dehalococcoidia bacterium]|nr:extracellular solute-binding protein [Dehalococcoidia bacterium]